MNIHEINKPRYETPELFPERAVLEGLRPEMLTDFIEECFEKQRELSRLIELAIDVKENGYGA
jgi:hypothetical protein